MMPSSSKKQHNLMEAVAHNPAFAKKVGIPQKVGKDFAEADKGKKFASGGMSRAKQQGINKPKTNHGAEALFKRGGDMAKAGMKKMASGGSVDNGNGKSMAKVRTAAPSKDGIASKGKTKGMMPKMAGTTTGLKRGGKTC